MEISLTNHGKTRLQQRSIPEEVLDVIQDFGVSARSHGADRYFLDKNGRQQLQRELRSSPLLKRYERYLNIYLVVSDDGRLITAGRRNKRFKRDNSTNYNR